MDDHEVDRCRVGPVRRGGPVSRSTVRGTLVINAERCKGCELCIAACPPGVLVMSDETNGTGFRYPKLHVGCTGCRACREICPDFVIDVFKFETPIEVEAADREGGPTGRILEL